jgi:multicomponent Na+:H+ antiporter subunit E
MNYFLINLTLGIIWLVLTGSFTFVNFMFGMVIGYFTLMITQITGEKNPYFRKVFLTIFFICYFVKELALANFKIAYDVLTPYRHYHMKAGIVAIPLSVKSDGEITLLANLITLTPGTLCLDVSDDRKVMYVHFMYFDNEMEARRKIKDGFEKRVIELFQ